MPTFHGHIENGSVVLDEPLDLPDGAAVIVVPRLADGGERGGALKGLAHLFLPEDLADIEAALRDCRMIDINGW